MWLEKLNEQRRYKIESENKPPIEMRLKLSNLWQAGYFMTYKK